MKKYLRNYATSAFLLLPATAAMLAAPSAVMAQPATPEVGALVVTADASLRPGSRMDFRLTGTPHTKASIRLPGKRESIALRETSPGIFVGSYTIAGADRFDRDTQLRAMLRHGNRQASTSFALADTMAVVAPPPRIATFQMGPVDARMRPGSTLRFSLQGTPGGAAIVDMPGIREDFALREVRPGFYEGAYTLRRGDHFNPERPIVATLRNGDLVVTTSLNQSGGGRPGSDNRAPTLTFLVPDDGATVPAGPSVHVAATFEDFGGSGVNPRSVQLLVSGRNVTQLTDIGTQSLSYWGVLPPGRHTAEVTARDAAGNEMRKSWSFNVAQAR